MPTTTTGTATDVNDLIDKYHTALLADGYTVNRYAAEGTGYALNVQKTIGSQTVYFNFRSNTGNYPAASVGQGILGNCSTSYNAGDNAIEQTDGPPSFSSGYVEFEDGEEYRFIHDTDYTALLCKNADGDWQHLLSTGTPTCFGWFGSNHVINGWYGWSIISPGPQQDTLFKPSNNVEVAGCAVRRDGSWYAHDGDTADTIKSILDTNSSAVNRGGPVANMVRYSPNSATATPVMCKWTILSGIRDSDYYPHQGPDGIRFLNMKYLNSEDVLTFQTKDYIVFQANPDNTDYGIAYRIT